MRKMSPVIYIAVSCLFPNSNSQLHVGVNPNPNRTPNPNPSRPIMRLFRPPGSLFLDDTMEAEAGSPLEQLFFLKIGLFERDKEAVFLFPARDEYIFQAEMTKGANRLHQLQLVR